MTWPSEEETKMEEAPKRRARSSGSLMCLLAPIEEVVPMGVTQKGRGSVRTNSFMLYVNSVVFRVPGCALHIHIYAHSCLQARMEIIIYIKIKKNLNHLFNFLFISLSPSPRFSL